jgi:hypothetical protein
MLKFDQTVLAGPFLLFPSIQPGKIVCSFLRVFLVAVSSGGDAERFAAFCFVM